MIDKSLNQAPAGLSALEEGPTIDIEIEIVGEDEDASIEDIPQAPDIPFDANLAEYIDPKELTSIANELLGDIEDDLASRKDWMQTYVDGLELLGMKIEERSEPWEGACGVYHPLLSEALVKFQAETIMSTFPAAGPVKTQIIGKETPAKKEAAKRVQEDMNHQLTDVMTEYRPEHERMLWGLGLSGNAFKKVYYDPSFKRQVSIFVPAEDIVVPYGASNLQTSPRITHVMRKTENELRKLQVAGFYRDIDLSTPLEVTPDAAAEAKAAQQGITTTSSNPDDRDREIYEIYCELNIKGFEHKFKGKITGLEIPYRVTIDVSSREILSITRNYDQPEAGMLPEARTTFVKYTFVPGLGFYGIGLLNILGNTTNAVTAGWRELLDAGMYANFPGFLISDVGARQNTNIFRVPPGGGAQVKTGGQKIGDAIMPLPYKEPSGALMSLVQDMSQTGMRVGGTSEAQVGEGRADAPVGTTLAMIEQATKILNAVHKRMHSAQAEEFSLLVQCFREHPESFWERNRKPTIAWNEELFMQALTDVELVPQADPNTSSQSQRLMKVMALKQLQSSNPSLYDPLAIDKAAMRAIGWSNPEQFLLPEDQRNQPPPELLKGIEDVKIAHQKADADTMRAQAAMIKAQQPAAPAGVAGPAGKDPQELQNSGALHGDVVVRPDHLQLCQREKRRRWKT